MNEVAKMEPRGDVIAAISKAMSSVKKVAKDGKNTHDNYSFASIDDFLAMVNPICAEAGLIFHMEELGTEDFMRKSKYGESAWMRMRFAVTVFHTSGQSLPPVSRSVEVLRNGAQAYGSAQSYALKQFLRSLLLIPTGDKDDADFHATGDGEIVQASVKSNPQAEGISDAWRDAVLDSLPENASPRVKAEAFAKAICDDFDGKGAKALDNRWTRHEKMIRRFQNEYPDLFDVIVDAFETRRNELSESVAAQ